MKDVTYEHDESMFLALDGMAQYPTGPAPRTYEEAKERNRQAKEKDPNHKAVWYEGPLSTFKWE